MILRLQDHYIMPCPPMRTAGVTIYYQAGQLQVIAVPRIDCTATGNAEIEWIAEVMSLCNFGQS